MRTLLLGRLLTFQPSTPARVSLACIRPDVDVDEPLTRCALHKRTHQGRHSRVAVDFDAYAELEIQIIPSRSLRLNDPVRAATAFLQAEVYALRRALQDDAKRQFTFHIVSLVE